MLIQIVIVAVLFGALLMTWKRTAQGVVSRFEALLWSVLWIGAGGVVMLPQTATIVANFFGVGRGSDFVLYGSVVLLFVLVFKTFISLDRMERNLTEVVRKESLREIERK